MGTLILGMIIAIALIIVAIAIVEPEALEWLFGEDSNDYDDDEHGDHGDYYL